MQPSGIKPSAAAQPNRQFSQTQMPTIELARDLFAPSRHSDIDVREIHGGQRIYLLLARRIRGFSALIRGLRSTIVFVQA
jgi:hypothetical protein